MAITLTVQTGVYPVRNANAFASVEQADNYHAQRGNTEWAGFDADKKKAALIKGADFIAQEFNFRGRPMYSEEDPINPQFLPFPRHDFVDKAGRSITGTPEGVVRANMELALFAGRGDLYPNQTTLLKPGGAVTKVSKKTGPLTTTYEYANPVAVLHSTPHYKKVSSWLKDYVYTTGRIHR
ncbi:virion structural protein [Vibrio phage F23s1]|nr:virion structural protein [Vibrio phage F23s1]